jgi:hypothetical protein
MRNLSIAGVMARFLASFALVVATYNPTGHSFVHWVAADFPHLEPLQLVLGIGLLALWLFVVHATWRSLGTVGVVLGVAFFAAMAWLFTSWGWVSLSNNNAVIWAALCMMTSLLTLGLCWALIQARLTGQAVVEEVKR